jgi:hypothetical protein
VTVSVISVWKWEWEWGWKWEWKPPPPRGSGSGIERGSGVGSGSGRGRELAWEGVWEREWKWDTPPPRGSGSWSRCWSMSGSVCDVVRSNECGLGRKLSAVMILPYKTKHLCAEVVCVSLQAVVCFCANMKWRLQNKSAAYRRECAQGKCNRDTRTQRWNGTRVQECSDVIRTQGCNIAMGNGSECIFF